MQYGCEIWGMHSPGLSGFARVATLVLLGMKGTLFLSVLPLHLYGGGMLACSLVTPIPRGPFSPSVIIWEYFTTS